MASPGGAEAAAGNTIKGVTP